VNRIHKGGLGTTAGDRLALGPMSGVLNLIKTENGAEKPDVARLIKQKEMGLRPTQYEFGGFIGNANVIWTEKQPLKKNNTSSEVCATWRGGLGRGSAKDIGYHSGKRFSSEENYSRQVAERKK